MSHYTWLDEHLPLIFEKAGLNFDINAGIISCQGDKCYSYRSRWEEAGIPFEYGVAIYLMSYLRPYSQEVRDTKNGWVDPGD